MDQELHDKLSSTATTARAGLGKGAALRIAGVKSARTVDPKQPLIRFVRAGASAANVTQLDADEDGSALEAAPAVQRREDSPCATVTATTTTSKKKARASAAENGVEDEDSAQLTPTLLLRELSVVAVSPNGKVPLKSLAKLVAEGRVIVSAFGDVKKVRWADGEQHAAAGRLIGAGPSADGALLCAVAQAEGGVVCGALAKARAGEAGLRVVLAKP